MTAPALVIMGRPEKPATRPPSVHSSGCTSSHIFFLSTCTDQAEQPGACGGAAWVAAPHVSSTSERKRDRLLVPATGHAYQVCQALTGHPVANLPCFPCLHDCVKRCAHLVGLGRLPLLSLLAKPAALANRGALRRRQGLDLLH